MGMSLGSQLMYGIYLGDSEDQEALEAFLGIEEEDFPEDLVGHLDEILRNTAARIATTHYYDYERYYLVVGDEENVFDGDPLKVTGRTHDPINDEAIKEACKILDIVYIQPEWLVGCSYF